MARLPADRINQFSWSPGSSVLAMVEAESISLWRVRDEKLLHTFKGEYLIGQKPIFFSHGSLLATNEEWNAGTVLWNIESGRRERVLRPSPRFEPDKDITVFANDVGGVQSRRRTIRKRWRRWAGNRVENHGREGPEHAG